MSFCPSSFEPSIDNRNYHIQPNFNEQSSCCQLPLSSFPNHRYQSDQFFSIINPSKQPSFPTTHVSCQTTSTLNKNQTGNNTTSTPSFTHRLINAFSSIYKPFSMNTNRTNDKCLPLLHEIFQDMINQYSITIEELEREIDYLSNQKSENSC